MSALETNPAAERSPELSQVHAALVAGERPPRPGIVAQCLTFGWRGMLKIKHVPEQLIDVTLTPVLFLLMFTYLFGGAVAGSTGDYLQFLLPGMLVQSVLFVSVYSGVALNTDMTKGVVDRFRSLPIWRPAPLVGAVVGDSVRYVLASAIVVVLGLIMGFDAEGGVPGVLAAVLIVCVFSFAFSWVWTMFGLLLRTEKSVMGVSMMVLFPLTFLSNVFVEPTTMPGWLRVFTEVNPITHLVAACRGLMQGAPDAGEITWVLVSAAVLTAIFGTLTMRLYNRK
jgi:ABC-2 type transport system permease protein